MALTLRLDDNDINKIDRLKNILNIKSSSKVITYLINDYESLRQRLIVANDNLHATTEKLNSLRFMVQENRRIQNKIDEFIENESLIIFPLESKHSQRE